MRELCAVWKWSVEERRGLFSRDHTPSLGDTGKKRESVQTRQHTLIIQFLSDRFGVIQSRSSAQVQLISEVLHTSLTLGVGPDSGQPQLMSRCPEAVCPRFKLLALGVQLLREKLLTNSVERTILREKIYNTVLDYFCYEPLWPVDDTVVVRETIATLIKFWVSVRDMKNTSIVSLSSSVLEISTAPIPRSSSSFWQLALSSQASPAQRGWINTLGSVRVSKGISSTLLSPHTSFHQPRTPPTASRRSSTVNKSKALLKRKSVILSLLRHEVERLTVWQNPSSLPDQSVPGEDEVHSWINPTQSERHWRSTIVMAYQASPHLAFHMINRFRSLEVVAKEVTRLVRSDPVPFHTIPGAAQLLARRDGLQQGAEPVATELYHLLYWRNISPASTLIFFCRPFSLHPITAQFASKAMQSFKPDDILLYIPQLVQALRYDKLGFAKSYILTAAKTSQLLAHQFLWNMEANTYVDGEMTQRDPEIGDLLVQLAGKIKAGMTGTALKFYEREFTFFRKVTNISGIIRPYPKGPQRNSECLKALKEVELLPGVYLPSNPDSVVVEIDHGSGTPMQSAAKAPFLARFKVVKCGTGEVEKMNTHDEEVLSSLSSQLSPRAVWQAAIFKVGDDVRQDMLALQIIQLFRDVFHSVGLSLYLVPYRVVATACGCGVIEVVPDSKSRDKIGKQTQVSLREYFRSVYGSEDSVAYQEARANFVRSMAAYSLVSYLLQIKDRHNGNIMVDKHGHIIHIGLFVLL
jgi:phosphatidylinositol 4-kinase